MKLLSVQYCPNIRIINFNDYKCLDSLWAYIVFVFCIMDTKKNEIRNWQDNK